MEIDDFCYVLLKEFFTIFRDPEELLADVVPAIGVTYPVLPIASLLPYISRGAQTIFELYAKWGVSLPH